MSSDEKFVGICGKLFKFLDFLKDLLIVRSRDFYGCV
jgi:hypothetical protein